MLTRRHLMLPLVLALLAAMLLPASAHAEIIDFTTGNDRDRVPQILPDEDLERYDLLRDRKTSFLVSELSPDGRFVMLGLPDLDMRLFDTRQQQLKDFEALGDLYQALASGQRGLVSPFLWLDEQTAVVVSIEYVLEGQSLRPVFSQHTVDALGRSIDRTQLDLPLETDDGLAVSYYTGAPLLQTADGRLHMRGYTSPAGLEAVTLEAPRYDPRSEEELESLGFETTDDLIAQSTGQVVLIALDDGQLTPVTDVRPGTNLGVTLSSLAVRPGADTVSFVEAGLYPWRGEVIGGRGARGGHMPLSYWNVQEALGNVPEAENRHIVDRRLHLRELGAADGAGVVVENAEHTPGMFADTTWTADGSQLIVTTALPSILEGRAHPVYEYPSGLDLRVFDPDGTPAHTFELPQLVAGGSGLQPLDGSEVLLWYGAHSARHFATLDVADPAAELDPVYTGPRFIADWSMRGDWFISRVGDIVTPFELYLSRARDVARSMAPVTNFNLEDLVFVNQIDYEVLGFNTSDGQELVGLYVFPSDQGYPPAEPQPVVVWQAGGPGPQMTNTWGTSVESPYSLLPNFGVPLLVLNASGRTTTSAALYSAMADGTNFGQRDILDAKEAVEQLIRMGIADPERIGVTGCSYGGYFTLQSMTSFPDFYAAGNAQCSLSDIIYEWNFGWSPFMAYLMGRAPTADPEEYVRDSPLYRAGRVSSPLLIFHGAEDFLPHEHMTNFHDQVEMNGVPVTFLRVRGEGHGFGRDASQYYAAQMQIDFFQRHLEVSSPAPAVQLLQRFVTLPGLPSLPIERGGVR